jgi:hypothetical protein
MDNKIHVIYAYYEKDADYKLNLAYFLKYAYLPHLDYTIVINGKCTVNIPKKNNIVTICRENTGYDFQGYYTGLLSLKSRKLLQPLHYYIFINCTVRGPFLPPYVAHHIYWYTPYIDLIYGNVKLVGSTINGKYAPHVQSYLFVMDYECVNYLLTKNFFKVYTSREDVIMHQEIAMSQLVINNGWNIDCLIPEYAHLNYRDKHTQISNEDIRFSKTVIGRDICPYEAIFVKSNWGDPTNQIKVFTELNEISTGEKLICHLVTYGLAENNSVDVTHIIRTQKQISTVDMKPNVLFGDPYPEKSKKLYIYVMNQTKPIILHELENKIVDRTHYYIFDGSRTNLYVYKCEKLL